MWNALQKPLRSERQCERTRVLCWVAGLWLTFTPGVMTAQPVATPTPAVAVKDPFPGYPRVGFERLASYKYETPGYDPQPAAGAGKDQIPAEIRALNGTKATVVGFMLPTKLDGPLVKEFLLVRDPMMCCYGVVPQMNEWVVVKMATPVPYLPDIPRAVCGTLKVGEMYDNGYLSGLYFMDGLKMGEDK